ncbi:MAG: glycoside hydrolase family 38 C-terminal domain-containing protein [Acidimicrobiales bacterium]
MLLEGGVAVRPEVREHDEAGHARNLPEGTSRTRANQASASTVGGTKRRVSIVPHTHWDREWYSPFQTFRLRLVDVLDELLAAMELDPSYTHFLLDGQMAVVDDYLAVRPEAADTIRRLAVAGRLAMGPWYTLMDEFLVSGETIIRNLQRGLDRAAEFGGAMEVGYLPDMFGHVAQMPQLLHLAGLDHAVVWRGVPSTVTGTAFWWEAPDGSTVRAEYLPFGYGNGAAVPDDAKALLARVEAHVEELGARLDDGSLLWMNGTDHEEPQAWLGRVVAEVNAMAADVELVVTPLADHLADAPTTGLPTIAGELRSGANANLLMGVASNRVDVKQAASRAETVLERRAEPLSALFLPPERWPGALLDEAWLLVIRNSAHDSVCACSHDDVCDAVLHRYAEARHIGEGLAERALETVAATLGVEGPVVVNSTNRPRSAVVELDLPGEDEVEGTQLLGVRPSSVLDLTLAGEELEAALGQFRSQEIQPGLFVNHVSIDATGDVVDVRLHADRRLQDNLLVEDVKAELRALAADRPERSFHITVTQPPGRQVLARVVDVPGFGWKAWEPAPLDLEPVRLTTSGRGLANSLVTVEVDPATGAFACDGIARFDRLVDDGDHGDTYNYNPPDHDVVVSEPDTVAVDVLETGPLRGRIEVTRSYTWPERVDDATRSRVGGRTATVVTLLEVRAGERLVRVTTEVDNQIRDHRLRTWFPLPERATSSTAECAYATVERGLTAEGGPTEHGLPTFPSRRFVRAGGLTVVHEGLLEYELVDVDAESPVATAGALALTLLRSTGMLSRVELGYRPLPAGPPIPLAGAQALGRHVLRYGVALGDVDPYALADDLLVPLDVVTAAGIGTGAAEGAVLTVTGAEVTAVTRNAGALEVRLCNPTAGPAGVRIPSRAGWLVDLRGRALEPFAEELVMGPWQIATLQLCT